MEYKSKFKAEEIDYYLEKVKNGGTGGGVPIVSSDADLDAKAPAGSLAVVAKESTLREVGFNDLFQITNDMMDGQTGAITNPELLSSVPKIKFLAPEGEIAGSKVNLYIVPRSFSMSNPDMIMLQITVSNNIVTKVGCLFPDMPSLVFITYNNGVPTVNQADIDQLNEKLKTDDWCYLGAAESGFVLTEDQKATIDKFFRISSGEPASGNLYIKRDEWQPFVLEQELANTKAELNASMAVLDSKIKDNYPLVEIPEYENGIRTDSVEMQPNVYYKVVGKRSGKFTITLLPPTDESIVNEYVLEAEVFSRLNLILPSEVKWVGCTPILSDGKIIISIVNNIGLYTILYD